MKVLLVGEPMQLFMANETGELKDIRSFTASVAGAELNVAIGLKRLGHEVAYYTRLGTDPFGEHILDVMRENGIDTSLITRSQSHKTGFMLKSQTRQGDPSIFYFRSGSAASSIGPEDIETLDLTGCDCLHMTGIFPALSDSTRQAAFLLMEKAKKAGLLVSFDPNLRPQLWPNRDTMVETLNRLAVMADLFLPGCGEGEILMGSRDPQSIAAFYQEKGVPRVIVKTGKQGAFGADRQECIQVPTYQEDCFVDTVGAGDGFAAGILSAMGEGLSLRDCLLRANAIGTIQIMNPSDNEGLPTREQLKEFMDTHSFKEIS